MIVFRDVKRAARDPATGAIMCNVQRFNQPPPQLADLGSLNSPEWVTTATLRYDIDNYGVSLVGRYYDATTYDVAWVEGREVDDNWAPSQNQRGGE